MCIRGQYRSPASKRCRQGMFPARTYFWWIFHEKGVYVSVLIWLCQELILYVLLCFFMAVLSMWPTFNKSFINHAATPGIWRISTCKTNVTRQLENITFDSLLHSVWNESCANKSYDFIRSFFMHVWLDPDKLRTKERDGLWSVESIDQGQLGLFWKQHQRQTSLPFVIK